MTKRLGDCKESYPKKQKTELDLLWGDDFDVQDVDDCFQLAASQICEQEVTCSQQNASIVPTYSSFKQQTKRAFTSTQSNPELNSSINIPSTSKNAFGTTNGVNYNNHNGNGLKRTFYFDNNVRLSNDHSKLQKVQDQYFAKEGEISILRTQLKDIKLQNDKEHVKREKEWSEKYTNINKQLTAVKSELEFKNLEIANLKQKVTEKIKTVNRDSQLYSTQSSFFKEPKHPKIVERITQNVNDCATSSRTITQKKIEEDFTIYSAPETYFPLQDFIKSSIFDAPHEERYAVDIKNNRAFGNTIPFTQNQVSQEQRLSQIQPKKVLLPNDKELDVSYIQTDLYNLMKCTTEELEASANYSYINKIVYTSEQLCDNLSQFLLELERGFVTDNSGKVDMLHLKNNFNTTNSNSSLFSPEAWLDGEIGIGARQSIACVAHILPNSSYLRQYLLENKGLIFNGDEDYFNYLPVTKLKLQDDYINNYSFLNTLLSIVNTSGKLRNSHKISGFLSAVCLLLDKIYMCNTTEETHLLITRLTREIVFVCPNVQVLCYLSDFFKNAALHEVFIKDLCQMSSKGGLKVDQIEKIVYYKQDVCMLQVFCVLVEYSSSKRKCEEVLDLYLTVMTFIKCCFKVNLKWMYYQENNHCDCLCKIVKLGVDILYQIVEMCMETHSRIANSRKDEYQLETLSRFTDILRNGIDVLQIFKYKVYDIIIKYIGTYSQYKVIIKSLTTLKDALHLSEIQEERLANLTDLEETTSIETDISIESLWN